MWAKITKLAKPIYAHISQINQVNHVIELWTTSMQLHFNLEFEIWKYEIWMETIKQLTHGSKLVDLLLCINDLHAPMFIVKGLKMN